MIVLEGAKQETLVKAEAFDLRDAEKAEGVEDPGQGKDHFTPIQKKRILVPTGVLRGT